MQRYPPAARLSRREREVVEHIVDARDVKDIAHRMGLSVATVRQYLARIYATLGFHSRAELQLWGTYQRIERAHARLAAEEDAPEEPAA